MASATGRDTGAARSRKRASDAELGFPKKPRIEAKTDRTRWRMKDDDSRHTWHYLADDEAVKDWPQSYAEKYYMNLPLVRDVARYLARQDLEAYPCAVTRIFLLSRKPKPRWTRRKTASRSLRSSNCRRAIGDANTADPCSCSQESSSPGT